MDTEDERLLAEQQTFYRCRAGEYDEWWQRRGRYDRGREDAAEWQAEVAQVERSLSLAGGTGDVLELAGGTGWWTERLAATATTLTVVDGSVETLELNRRRVRRDDVSYLEADLFTWEPPVAGAFDLVFFSFWLSHVPRHRVGAFWSLVARCLAPDGCAFLIDNRDDPRVTRPDPYVYAREGDVQRRRLNDGSEHRVVKVFYQPDELVGVLAPLGWDATIQGTRRFIYGRARLSGSR